jgi:hypothetical protein
MLTGTSVPRLTHVLKSVLKDDTSNQWMEEVDMEHLYIWMESVGTSTLDINMTAQ